ncbi:MAG: ion transporter [Saprospiraceae bacterium]|nr:ion transporter [Saprospiraceae bacterium]
MTTQAKSRLNAIRQRIFIAIYGVNTPGGKLFDLVLLVFIILSVGVIMLETVPSFDQRFHKELFVLEWVFTILFTLEYGLRIFSTNKPIKYIFSFYGIIDLLAILPMYISFFVVGSNIFSSVRTLRLLRLFRILKLIKFIDEATRLKIALLQSRAKITVFLYALIIIAMTIGTLMYYIEGPENGFTSIPKSIYWTIVTLTTVGYGDIVPQTALGQFLSMILMITGYGVIAVPTGIISAEFIKQGQTEERRHNGMVCSFCNFEKHNDKAEYCYNCGNKLKL